MVDASPFVSFFIPLERTEPNALLGFTLPVLPSSKGINTLTQMRMINSLWASGVTALDMRFVVTTSAPGVRIYLLCRMHRPPYVEKREFQDYCSTIAKRIKQLYMDCGYDLLPLISEAALTHALTPFQIQAFAEVRRKEELLLLYEAYTEYEIYVTHPWEWSSESHLPLFEILSQQRSECLVSIYLEPTRLSIHEQSSLNRATSGQVRELFGEGSSQGRAIYNLYQAFAQKLQQPYLLRICLAAPTQQMVARVGREILDRLQFSEVIPVLQFPQMVNEHQAAVHNLRYLEGVPWGNIRDNTPDTARLRYLVDSKGASMGFHLPVAPEPVTSKAKMMKVLLVFANPHTLERKNPLRLGTEDRVIHEAIKLSRYRDNIELTVRHAATIHDISRALLDDEFQVVHIAGHGSSSRGLVLEDETGKSYFVPQQALANLFKAYNSTLSCVVLNACYSHTQGELIALGVDFTIAMEGQLGDDAAREFSRGFYDALGAGKEIDFAYEEGCRRVGLAVPTATFVSRLLRKA